MTNTELTNKIFDKMMSALDDIERQVVSMNGNGITWKVNREPTKERKVAKQLADDLVKQANTQKKQYTQKRRDLANKVSEMARTANKRLDRLERNGLEKHSAYMAWQKDGKIRFSVKGKSYQQLQREYWRVKKFLDSETSTIKGAKQNMQRVAKDIIGLKAEKVDKMSLNDLKNSTKNFFDIKDRLEEKYRDSGQNAKAIDYQKLMNEVANYMKRENDDLSGIDSNFNENSINDIADKIMGYIEKENEDITDVIVEWS